MKTYCVEICWGTQFQGGGASGTASEVIEVSALNQTLAKAAAFAKFNLNLKKNGLAKRPYVSRVWEANTGFGNF